MNSKIDTKTLSHRKIKNIIFTCKNHLMTFNMNTMKEIVIPPAIVPGSYDYRFDGKISLPSNIKSIYRFDKDTVSICIYGGIGSKNNQVNFIKNVFIKLIEHEKNIQLILVGYVQEDPNEFIDIFKKYPGMYKKIHLIGSNYENHLSIVNQTDIIINYATFEKLPTYILEAMYLGKPIVSITSGFTCCSDVITNEYNGFLSDNDDILINNLLKLIRNSDERIRMGNNAKVTFINKYTENNFNEYLKFMK